MAARGGAVSNRRADAGTAAPRVLDNRAATVADFLRRRLPPADRFRAVSAYFSIYGYGLLADELDAVPEVRFLFGDPASAEELDPGARPAKSFALIEGGLVPRHALRQKHLAKRCREWIRREGVSVRTVRRAGFLHGKMYLTETGGEPLSAVVGSSNFTKRGLGGGDRPNLEINLVTEEPAAVGELRDWFDRLWTDDGPTEDASQRVLAALDRLGRDYAPEMVYFKTLYEIFREEIEARRDQESAPGYRGLYRSRVWNALYAFQQDGARSVIAKLRSHGGCILADSVGLGKTYTALAVIHWFESRNQRVLVLCPRKLQQNWALYQAHRNHRQNPFPEDRFGYTLLAHTDLSRDSGISNGVDLAHFRWENYDLVVIDESHNFRNHRGQRYRRLLDEAIAGGGRTSVLMLSATPVNTSLTDLRNQVRLMTEGRDDAFRESLGVEDLSGVMREAEAAFRQWESGRRSGARRPDKADLLRRFDARFFRLLGGVSIARSRRQIENNYRAEMERIGRFPKREPPENRYPVTDLEGRLSYRDLADAIGAFTLAVYRPSEYVADEGRRRELEEEKKKYNFDQRDRERALVAMMRVNFLKRLESSPDSLRLTLERTIGKIERLLERIERYERRGASDPPGDRVAATAPSEDEGEEDEDLLLIRGGREYRFRELALPRWKNDLENDRTTLEAARVQVAGVGPARDGKLRELRRLLRERAEKPTTDADGKSNRKVLVFTTFKDTAKYLYRNLEPPATELGLRAAWVSGDETGATAGGTDFNEILTNFAPTARRRPPGEGAAVLDLLIATDCISEGQNLQDCDLVVNYDIHWNPVRLIQRFGRVDRIGSRSRAVRMVNFWPTEDMEVYLRLERRVQARMALADLAATGDDDPFDEERARRELGFRDRQLRALQQETPTLDDLDEGPALSDFTLDHFFSQLLRYLEINRAELEAMPLGAYAVADAARAAGSSPGVLFVLRQRTAEPSGPRQQTASPVHPHYLVLLRRDGSVRLGCGLARPILAAFEAVAAGETAPLRGLCEAFDRETGLGRKMDAYDRLLENALAHIRGAHDAAQRSGLGVRGDRAFRLPLQASAPRTAADFELVTWLVLATEEAA